MLHLQPPTLSSASLDRASPQNQHKCRTAKTRTMSNSSKRSRTALSAPLLPLLLLLCCCFQFSECLIVPQELPSLLSLVYSNIPPIKKGTDSRLGFGFRLGENADFQVLVELGPQKNTRPIGDPDKEDNSFNKRHVSKKDQRAVLRQQQLEQFTSTERTASNWLQNWSKDMNDSNSKKRTKTKQRIGAPKKHQQQEKDQLLPAMPLVASHSLQQLQMLYKMATTTTEESPSRAAPQLGGPLNLGGPAGFKAQPSEAQAHLMAFVNPRQAHQAQQKTKEEITAELSDVSLEQGA